MLLRSWNNRAFKWKWVTVRCYRLILVAARECRLSYLTSKLGPMSPLGRIGVPSLLTTGRISKTARSELMVINSVDSAR